MACGTHLKWLLWSHLWAGIAVHSHRCTHAAATHTLTSSHTQHTHTQTHSTHACWQVEWQEQGEGRGPGQCLWAHKNHMQWPYKVSWPLLIIYKAQPSELQSIRSALAKPGKRDWQAAEQAAGKGGRWDCVRGATSVNKSLWKSAVQTSWWLMQLELQTYSLRRYPNETYPPPSLAFMVKVSARNEGGRGRGRCHYSALGCTCLWPVAERV